MQLALIPPLCFIDHMGAQPYSLFLPQLMQQKKYCDAVWESTRKDDGLGILDNGAAEGVKTTIKFLLDMADFRGIEEIVVPDTIADAEASMHQLLSAEKYLRDQPSFSDHSYMAVLQGKTVDEMVEYAMTVSDMDWIGTIGIPRHINKTSGDINARLKVLDKLARVDRPYDIHMLGAAYNYPTEIKMIHDSFKPMVRGMDTSIPYVYAYNDLEIAHTTGRVAAYPESRPEDYFNIHKESFNQKVLEENISTMRGWIGE